MKKKIFAAAVSAVLILASVCPVYAREPYSGYTYNSYGERVPAPNAFLPEKVITGLDVGIGLFSKPTDIFVDVNNDIYVLDAGNGRIVILDENFGLKKVIDKFVKDGEDSPIKDASGIFAVPGEGRIYIADKGNERVAVCDYDGNIVREERKPETEYLGDEIVFAPKKVVVNGIGTMYVLSENINQGMVAIDSDGVFQGFFGAEKIQLTLQQELDRQWRKFSTKEQQSYTTTFQPTEYSNIFIDSEDFIYTTTAYEGYQTAQVKRLNPNGKNILYTDMMYGETEVVNNVPTVSALIDVTVDRDGFIFALDRNFGRIYMYDQQSWDLAVFGKKDTVWGTFGEPIAIENLNGKIIVLDNTKANIVVFEPTEYGKYIMSAINYHYKGRYEQAKEPWTIVNHLNSNYEFAYAGLGRAEHMVGEYRAAMYNFERANKKELYSKAKKKYRNYVLRENFTAIALSLLTVVIGGYIIIKKRKSISKLIKARKEKREGEKI